MTRRVNTWLVYREHDGRTTESPARTTTATAGAVAVFDCARDHTGDVVLRDSEVGDRSGGGGAAGTGTIAGVTRRAAIEPAPHGNAPSGTRYGRAIRVAFARRHTVGSHGEGVVRPDPRADRHRNAGRAVE